MSAVEGSRQVDAGDGRVLGASRVRSPTLVDVFRARGTAARFLPASIADATVFGLERDL